MEFKEERIEKEEIFSGYVFDVSKDKVRLHNGTVVTRELVLHNGGVAVVAINTKREIVLVRQYRYGAGEELYELPAGKLEKNEDPIECGIRELKEETGYTAENFEYLCETYVSPAYCSEKIYIYSATKLSSGTQNLDENEFLEIIEIPFEQAVEMCLDGRIVDGKSIIGILTYKIKEEGC